MMSECVFFVLPLLRTTRRHPPPQQLRQLGDVGGHPPGLVVGEQLGRRAASRLLLEIDVGEMRLGLPARAAFY